MIGPMAAKVKVSFGQREERREMLTELVGHLLTRYHQTTEATGEEHFVVGQSGQLHLKVDTWSPKTLAERLSSKDGMAYEFAWVGLFKRDPLGRTPFPWDEVWTMAEEHLSRWAGGARTDGKFKVGVIETSKLKGGDYAMQELLVLVAKRSQLGHMPCKQS